MGYLGDVFGFEKFALSDMFKKVKKDPERLLIGAVDPLSTKMWNKILKKDYEPLVDQMGGQYGGHTISAFGKNDGGVYKRAQEAGINTGPGGQIHDAAHVVSALYGGAGLGGIGGAPAGGAAPSGGGLGTGVGSDLGFFSNGGAAGMQGVGGGSSGLAAANGIIPGGAGMGSMGAGGLGNLGMQDYMKLGQQAMGGQQQQQAPPPPQYNPPQQQSFGQKMMGGLGRARDALTPIDPRVEAEMSPEYVKQLRNQAMLKMGLGMMSASNQGGGFGESVAAGLGQAQGGFNKDIEGSYQKGVKAREEKRDIAREAELDKRYYDETGYERNRDSEEDKRWVKTFEATERHRKDVLKSLENRAKMRVPGQSLSDQAVDFAAQRLVNGEQASKVLANFGRGAQGAADLRAVQNRFAALAMESGIDASEIAVRTQELSAEGRTRTELGAREGKVAARVQEAQTFARIALGASQKIPRGKFLPWNKLSQMTDTQMNDPELAAFKAANVSLINAYAAAIGGGVPTVHDKEAAEAMLNTAQSPKAYAAVVNQLIVETEAALDAPGDVMERMRNHGLGQPPAPPAPSAPVGGGWSIKPKN